MEPRQRIQIETVAQAPIEKVWDVWVKPEYIQQWNAATTDWECPVAVNDLRVGGVFSYRMEAKDKSFGFDFGGTYTEVIPLAHIAYTIGDGREVSVAFEQLDNGVKVTETFEAEEVNPIDNQRAGWQSILDSFKKCVESV